MLGNPRPLRPEVEVTGHQRDWVTTAMGFRCLSWGQRRSRAGRQDRCPIGPSKVMRAPTGATSVQPGARWQERGSAEVGRTGGLTGGTRDVRKPGQRCWARGHGTGKGCWPDKSGRARASSRGPGKEDKRGKALRPHSAGLHPLWGMPKEEGQKHIPHPTPTAPWRTPGPELDLQP